VWKGVEGVESVKVGVWKVCDVGGVCKVWCVGVVCKVLCVRCCV
jgi:hypothetical protein